jgi:hypothetical protein
MATNEHAPAILENELSTFLIDKAPVQLPDNFKEGFVKYFPYVLLVLMVLSALAVIPLVIGIAVLLATGAVYSLVLVAIGLVSIILNVMALPGLFKQQRGSWVLAYYADLLGLLSNILSISVVGIVISILFLFVMFQVKSYYKN